MAIAKRKKAGTIHSLKRQKLVSGQITFVNQIVLFENMKKDRHQFQIRENSI